MYLPKNDKRGILDSTSHSTRRWSARSTNLVEDNVKQYELRAFVFLVVFLAPILSVVIVGGWGFVVWMSQLILGPPGS
jgi:periplasmic nitrate reductase NapE